MTEQELEELEGALRAASPAPWRALIRGLDGWSSGMLYAVSGEPPALGSGLSNENAAAIVALRNAGPSLISEVRRLRARVKELEERCERFKEQAEIGDVFLSD